MTNNPRHVSEIMRDMFKDFPKTMEERRAERIEARNREMPKICELLDIEFKPMSKDAA
jgi:hypothetical protein